MAILDCFTFFNEVDILRIRLHELNPVVDQFVLVEATTDFRGRARDPIFESLKTEFEPYLSKISHVVVDDLPVLGNPWIAEYAQRDAILRGIGNPSPDDIIMVSDVDEIPRREVIARLGILSAGEVIAFDLKVFYYGLSWASPIAEGHSRAVAAETLSWITPHEMRVTPYATKHIPNAGWHLSYFFPSHDLKHRLRLKATSFAHSEFANDRYLNDRYLAKCIMGGLSWCTDPPFRTRFRYTALDKSFPKLVQEEPGFFSDYSVAPEERHRGIELLAAWLHFRGRFARRCRSALHLVHRVVVRLRPR